MGRFLRALLGVLAALNFLGDVHGLADSRHEHSRFYVQINVADRNLHNQICHQVRETIVKVDPFQYIDCQFGSSKETEASQIAHFHHYLVKFVESGQELIFTFDHLGNEDTDVDQIKIPLKNKNEMKGVRLVIEKAVEYDRYKDIYKDYLIHQGMFFEGKITPLIDGRYQIDDGKIQRFVNKELAYQYMKKEGFDKVRNHVRAGLEIGFLLGLGGILYKIGPSMAEDWDFENNSLSKIGKRIIEWDQYRFDDNGIAMNWGHTYQGTLSFNIYRSNGYTFWESFLAANAASLIWEIFIEHKEVISVNDIVTTGLGGPIVGEVTHQISHLLLRRGGKYHRYFAALINPFGVYNDSRDRRKARKVRKGGRIRLLRNGFDPKKIEEFHVVHGLKMAKISKGKKRFSVYEIGIEAEVIPLPVNGIGKVRKIYQDPIISQMVVRGGISKGGLEDFQMVAKTAIAGYFAKDVGKDENGRPKGYSFVIGPAGRAEYTSRGQGHENDFYGVVNVLGGTMDVTFFNKNVKYRFSIDIYGDFAMVRPYAIDDYFAKGFDFKEARTELRKRDYYFAKGLTVLANFKVEAGKWSAGFGFTRHRFDSIDSQGLQRLPEKVTNDVRAKDQVKGLAVWFAYRPKKRWELRAKLENIFRQGKIYSNQGELIAEEGGDDVYVGLELNYRSIGN